MDLYEELKSRGLVYQVSSEEGVKKLLNAKGASFYAGFDPSAESLQAGNLLIIVTMKRLERAGLKPIVLVGGATGLIGDPSFKDKKKYKKKKIIFVFFFFLKKTDYSTKKLLLVKKLFFHKFHKGYRQEIHH